jgi:hypothetical protein
MPVFVRYRYQRRVKTRWIPTKIAGTTPALGSGLITGTSTATGTLHAKGYVDVTAAGTSTTVGILSAVGTLIGSENGSSAVTGDIKGVAQVEASSSGTATATGTITAIGSLTGDISGTSTGTGVLQATGRLTVIDAGTATASASLRGKGYLDATDAGIATVSGTLQLPNGQIAGAAAGTAAATADIVGKIKLFSAVVGTSTASGIAVGIGAISASQNGSSTATAILQGTGYLVGVGSGSSTASAITVETVEIEDSVPMLSAGIWRKSQPNTILFVLVDDVGAEVVGLGSGFTLQIRKIGGSFQNGAGTKSEVGLGWYQYVSTAAEASISGPVAIVVTAAGVVQQNLEYVVEDRVVNAVAFAYTLTLSDNITPISNVNVSFSVSTNPAESVWSGITDSFGVARDLYGNLPRLNPGSYYIFSNKPGYIFETDLEAVS